MINITYTDSYGNGNRILVQRPEKRIWNRHVMDWKIRGLNDFSPIYVAAFTGSTDQASKKCHIILVVSFFLFSSLPGESSNLTIIFFQMGWNHQLEYHFGGFGGILQRNQIEFHHATMSTITMSFMVWKAEVVLSVRVEHVATYGKSQHGSK